MIDWRELDEAIMKTIDRDGIRTFTAIAHRVEPQALPHAQRITEHKQAKRQVPTFRIVDRRLQALRSLGILTFTGKEWCMAGSHSAAVDEGEKK